MKTRKSIRLKNYDYSQPGYYYVTICTKNRIKWFGNVIDNAMILNKYGVIVNEQWMWLRDQYPYVTMDEYVVMPDHFHGIIGINVDVGTGRDLSLRHDHKIKPLPELIGAFKTTSSKSIHMAGLTYFHWQRSFYEHIIRNERELADIRQYIRDNPSGK